MSDPTEQKGIVRREIIRVFTPGTAVEGSIVERDHCYLLSLAPAERSTGAAYLDVSTGDFFVTSYSGMDDARLADDLARLTPREAIFPGANANGLAAHLSSRGIVATPAEESLFAPRRGFDLLTRHFGTRSLRGFGLEDDDPRVAAAGAALHYASQSHRKSLGHISSIRSEEGSECLIIDAATLQNLEIFDSRDERDGGASLWNVFTPARTAMGSRTLRRWLSRPLRDRDAVFARHDAVEELTRNRTLLEKVTTVLAGVADLERLASRITLRSATPRECLTLAASLGAIAEVREAMAALGSPLLAGLRERLDPLASVAGRIASSIDEAAPAIIREGGVIRDGVSRELDELREITRDSKSVLLAIESAERERSGIASLKVRFNNVFGYYIEISKSNLGKVPVDYIRKQTLVNAERYITPELKELEEKILGAEEKSLALETVLYAELLTFLADEAAPLLATARVTGEIDTLALLATTAVRRRYVRPQLSEECEIVIEEGRHPVVEQLTSERFIPNDSNIRREVNGMQLITGPNMGGKSTYLRQVALIVLMSQAGSFVPATSARLGFFDRIFTRVGASDFLARGESTFMVEMHETANILNNATDRSLIILDEVGRGTATFDGLSLAWAILEFLHDHPERGGVTLFATHYHELTDLARDNSRIVNFNVAVKEWNDQIIFLRKVVPGAADKSYGIQVAKLAGVPEPIIVRAREILRSLDRREHDVVEQTRRNTPFAAGAQLSLFQTVQDDVIRQIRGMPIDAMTPIEALSRLAELKKRLMD